MKLNKKGIISILLAMLMVLTSFGFVFAEVEETPQVEGNEAVAEELEETDVDEEVEEEYLDGLEAVEETPKAEAEEEAAEEAVEEEPYVEVVEEEEIVEEESNSVAPLLASDGNSEEIEVTVYYLYEDGSTAAKTVTGTYKAGDVIKSPTIACYKANKTEVTVKEGVQSYTVTYKPSAPAKVKGLKLHPSFNSIILTWNKVDGAAKYIIQRSTNGETYKNLKTVNATTAKTMTYKDTKANGTVKPFSTARKYYYRVYAVSAKSKKSKVSAVVSGTAVRPMYEEVTFKSSVTLGSHGGKKATHTFSGGQTIIAQGFGGGKYKFWYNGSYYYANFVRMKNCKAKYQANSNGIVGKATSYTGIWKKQRYAYSSKYSTSYKGIKFYSKTSAEDFVNKSGKSSGTKYLIWVSTYTQHLYVFRGSKGKWKLYKDWECSTGAGGSPTPTGFDKQINKKMYSYSGIKYWNPFQTLNSIHGQKSKYRFGKPQSNGCVRNYDANAKWIYENCKVGTGVIIY